VRGYPSLRGRKGAVVEGKRGYREREGGSQRGIEG